jgi:hypothetical protein
LRERLHRSTWLGDTLRARSGVYFDTNRAINDVGGEAGYPAPETRMAVRNA